MASLADEIDSAIVTLEGLLDRVPAYCERKWLPAEWDDDLTAAEEAAEAARSAIGQASEFNEHIDRVVEMLRKIDDYERDA